jgi:hypothetical protein
MASAASEKLSSARGLPPAHQPMPRLEQRRKPRRLLALDHPDLLSRRARSGRSLGLGRRAPEPVCS